MPPGANRATRVNAPNIGAEKARLSGDYRNLRVIAHGLGVSHSLTNLMI